MGELILDSRRQTEMYLLTEINAKVKASHLRVRWLADYNVFMEMSRYNRAVAIMVTKRDTILVLTYDIHRDSERWKTWDDHIDPDTALTKHEFKSHEIEAAGTAVIEGLMSA